MISGRDAYIIEDKGIPIKPLPTDREAVFWFQFSVGGPKFISCDEGRLTRRLSNYFLSATAPAAIYGSLLARMISSR